MRKLWKNKNADMNMILSAVIMAIVFAIGIVIVFSVFGGISGNLDTLDGDLATAKGLGRDTSDVTGVNEAWENYNASTIATNASDDVLGNVETFYTVGPIALIVVAAVGILSYILLLRRK